MVSSFPVETVHVSDFILCQHGIIYNHPPTQGNSKIPWYYFSGEGEGVAPHHVQPTFLKNVLVQTARFSQFLSCFWPNRFMLVTNECQEDPAFGGWSGPFASSCVSCTMMGHDGAWWDRYEHFPSSYSKKQKAKSKKRNQLKFQSCMAAILTPLKSTATPLTHGLDLFIKP